MTPPLVTADNGPRPNGRPDQCFYCHQMIGEYHDPNCVLWTRQVLVRAVVEYSIEVPRSWDKKRIESHRNDGTWCASNGLAEIEQLVGDGCGCGVLRYEYVGEMR